MAKTKISEYSSTAASNTDINGINIGEGCLPSNINNAIRELMAELKNQQAGTSGDDFTVTGTLYANGATVLGSTTTSSVTITSETVTVPSSLTLNSTGALKIPSGTTAQRPSASVGQIRYNSTLAIIETYDGVNWVPVGGANGAGGAIFENLTTISSNYTISTSHNGMSAGPITVASGVTVTVPSGSRWVVV